jgi:serine/threonine protein kinase
VSRQNGDNDPRIGQVLADRYRIDRLLGEGGMGKVYAAEHVLMRKRLALKVLHDDLSNVPEVVARFEREARAAANIEHPNIAAATDFGKLPDGAVYLALEYVEGTSLRDVIERDAPMLSLRALKIARQIASALASAHALDIVHRDLKPENVMLVHKGGDPNFVKVLDFGIAKVPIGSATEGGEQPITKMQMVLGTPEYMAPEQALSETVDGRSDVYALGVMLYEMLSGTRPFRKKREKGILAQQLAGEPPPFAQTAPRAGIPPQVESLVMDLLQVKRQARPQAIEVARRIDALLIQPLDQGGQIFTQFGGTMATGGSDADFSSAPELGMAESSPDLLPASAAGATRDRIGSAAGSLPGVGAFPDGVVPPWPGSAPDGVLPDPNSLPQGSRPDLVPQLLGAQPPSTRQQMPSDAGRGETASAEPSSAALIPGLGRPWPQPVLQLFAWIDARRSRLPPQLRDVPGPALVAAALALVAGALLAAILLLVAVTSPDAPAEPAGSASASAIRSGAVPAVKPAGEPTKEQLTRAKKQGATALRALARQYGRSAQLQLELAQAHRLERSYSETVAAVRKALALDPKLNTHKRVATLLWDCAQRAPSMAAAFELLRGPMGSKGADIIYDLATERKVRSTVKAQAAEFLKSDQFRHQASPALAVAVDLRYARSCAAAHALLRQAEQVGDERALTYLRRYEATRGCGRRRSHDCYPCMRQDARLRTAIAAIEKRIKG